KRGPLDGRGHQDWNGRCARHVLHLSSKQVEHGVDLRVVLLQGNRCAAAETACHREIAECFEETGAATDREDRKNHASPRSLQRHEQIPKPKSQNPNPKSQTRAAETQRHREPIPLSLCASVARGFWDLVFVTWPGLRLASTVLARRCVMAADSKDAVAHVQLVDGYRFTATFSSVAGAQPITLDGAPPLGEGAGPTPAGLLAAAIGGCLSASLTLCLNKA